MVDPKVLDGLTDEQLMELINAAGDKKNEKKKVRVQLMNGEVVEGDTPEEVNQILAQRLAAVQNQPEEVEEPSQPSNTAPNQPKLPKFDYKKFEKTFVEDPVAGLDYADTVRFGMPLSQLIPQLAQVLGVQNKKLQELEAQQFIDTNPEYEPSAENRKAIEKVMTERGWQTSRQTLEDAFAIAQSKGLIKSKDDNRRVTKQQIDEPFIPPRTTNRAEETNAEFELMNKLGQMTDEQITNLARQAGIISR